MPNGIRSIVDFIVILSSWTHPVFTEGINPLRPFAVHEHEQCCTQLHSDIYFSQLGMCCGDKKMWQTKHLWRSSPQTEIESPTENVLLLRVPNKPTFHFISCIFCLEAKKCQRKSYKLKKRLHVNKSGLCCCTTEETWQEFKDLVHRKNLACDFWVPSQRTSFPAGNHFLLTRGLPLCRDPAWTGNKPWTLIIDYWRRNVKRPEDCFDAESTSACAFEFPSEFPKGTGEFTHVIVHAYTFQWNWFRPVFLLWENLCVPMKTCLWAYLSVRPFPERCRPELTFLFEEIGKQPGLLAFIHQSDTCGLFRTFGNMKQEILTNTWNLFQIWTHLSRHPERSLTFGGKTRWHWTHT